MSTTPPIHAALVLGSDSFRLLVGAVEDGTLRPLDSFHAPLRLAAALDAQGCLSPEAMDSAFECLRTIRARLADHALAAVRVVATSTLRMARNSHLFLPAAQQLLGHPVHVLTGEEEAILTYLGVADGAAHESAAHESAAPDADTRTLVLGIGGGSTQLALGTGRHVQKVASLGLGTSRLALTFFGGGRIDAVSFAAAIASTRAKLGDETPAFGPGRRDRTCGASGTIHTLARLLADNDLAGPITRARLERLAARALDQGGGGAPLTGLGHLRLRDVTAALAILLGLMEELEIEELEVPKTGLRAGLLAELRHGRAALAA
jgi:exopolyphosphatase/guanosine-5'-triphosphate,3'-diphosphate pyrophosphatase